MYSLSRPEAHFHNIGGSISVPASPSHDHVLRQSACRVTLFSSQYGGEESAFAYTSQNLAGETRIYPRYGDCSHAAVFRTFGRWWHEGSLLWLDGEFDSAVEPNTLTDDFIQLSYTTSVYLKAVEIYETFNVGHIVRIFAGYSSAPEEPVDLWHMVWSGLPDLTLGRTARAFVPTLKLTNLSSTPVNAIRLEMCSNGADYYPELDAVYIHGTPVPNSVGKEQLLADPSDRDADTINKAANKRKSLEAGGIDRSSASHAVARNLFVQPFSLWSIQQALTDIQRLSIRMPNESPSPLNPTKSPISTSPTKTTSGQQINFDSLPHELIHTIVDFLPRHDRTRTLARLASVCKRLYTAFYDPSLHTVVDLKPAWNRVDAACLERIAERSRETRRMRLSWLPQTLDLLPFLTSLQTNRLHSLFLSSCMAVTDDVLAAVCKSQPQLAVLDLSSCRGLTAFGFCELENLTNLRSFSLYRTCITETVLVQILQNLTRLEIFNIGSLPKVTNMDIILRCLSLSCPNLKALDCWRGKSLTHFGLRELASGCPHVEELDLGWCGDVRSSTGIFKFLAKQLPRLRRLLLTANRTIGDSDLDCLATYLFNSLEHLDILGCRDVTVAGVLTLLDRCPKLTFLDISFCASLDFEEVSQLRKTFPSCSIKKSYQP